MKTKKCISCGKLFKPAPQSPKQTYCASTPCQKQRRRNWQKTKLRNDPDYKENQALAQKAWAKRNQDYWRKYRESERNQQNQPDKGTKTNEEKHDVKNIKMDLSSSHIPFGNGIFKLKVISNGNDANMDSWIIEITRFDEGSKPSVIDVKR